MRRPNVQQIKPEDDVTKRMKDTFVKDQRSVLVAIDFSHAEQHVIAVYVNNKERK